MDDPFAELDRMSGMMQARHEAMMRQAAELQQKVLAAHQREAGAGQQSQVVVSTNLPAGSYSYSMVSTSRNGCTQTVEWRSDGSANEQQVTKTAPGIAAAQKNAPATPAVAQPRHAPLAVPAAVVQGQARLPSKST